MNSDWIIRPAIAADADQLTSCMVAAYTVYQTRMGGKALPPMMVDYLTEIKNYPTWVVVDDSTVMAGLIMVIDEKHASIANIAVNPKYQGQKIGGALMDFAEYQAREKGFSKVMLTTHVLLTENIELYQHLGYQETSRDETKVFMEKKL